MPRLAELYFKTAILLLITGIVMGLAMSVSGNHATAAAHGHANLLGWVTMAVFGAYYAFQPEKAGTRFARLQYSVYLVGVLVTIPALYVYLGGVGAAEPIVAIGSFITFAGVLMFAVVVFSPARKQVSSGLPQGA